jgi:hypothetical protein
MKNDYTKQEKENAFAYAFYTSMYALDTLCNFIRELAPMIADKDKETRKIYGALKKRANSHLRAFDKELGKDADVFALFCEYRDEVVEDKLLAYKQSFMRAYRELPEPSYYAHIETIRILSEFVNNTIKNIVKKVVDIEPNAWWIKGYVNEDIPKIASNLADWVYNQIPNNTNVDFSVQKDVEDALDALGESLFGFESYVDAYKKAYCEKGN